MSIPFVFSISLLFVFVALIGLAFRKLVTHKSVSNTSFEDTDEIMNRPDINENTKFNDRCTLLSQECRGNDLWIVFIDENANLQEELQFEENSLCTERS